MCMLTNSFTMALPAHILLIPLSCSNFISQCLLPPDTLHNLCIYYVSRLFSLSSHKNLRSTREGLFAPFYGCSPSSQTVVGTQKILVEGKQGRRDRAAVWFGSQSTYFRIWQFWFKYALNQLIQLLRASIYWHYKKRVSKIIFLKNIIVRMTQNKYVKLSPYFST